ncbi:long-chain fatty acid--CoA ligase [bacterium]|nr:long-chain fatty acid--CoA ligase [bacterium]
MPNSLILKNNLAQIFFARVDAQSSRSAMMQKSNGHWKTYTWADYQDQVCRFAKVMQAHGIGAKDKVAILSNSRPEWAWIDVATLCLGAVTVPIYPSLLSDEIKYILKDSGAKLVFAEDNSQQKKLEEIIDDLGFDCKVIVLKDAPDSVNKNIQNYSNALSALDIKSIEASDIQALREITETLEETALASIVYTSGTSGVPKGAMLTHKCFMGIIKGAHASLGMNDSDTTLLFLPMAHILGRVEHMLSLGSGWTNAYAENLKVVMDNMVEVRPTIMVSVPRIYEKIYSMLVGRVQRMDGLSKIVADRAVAFTSVYSKAQERGQPLSLKQKVEYKIYKKALYDKVKARFGGRIRFCISGGAPFSPEISRFFHTCGVLNLEGYGLTETSGPLSVNRPDKFKIGTVGTPLEGTDVKIAADGEIILKGPIVMEGYYNSAEKTKEVFTEDGYFMTGDIGQIDSDGFISITDRKKDLIVTAGGKNIAPQKIESMLLEDPLFAQAIVIGDNQKYLGALVALSAVDAKQLAKSHDIDSAEGLIALYADPAFKKLVQARVQKVNTRLASFESIKKIEILPRELSLEEGELTPSLKVKRKHCTEKYQEYVAKLF